MRKLDKPTYSPEQVFKDCISLVRNKGLKKRLWSCKKEIISASNEFESKVANASLHTIITSDNILGIVTVDEMKKVYTDRMAKIKAPGRMYYDKIKSAPALGRCPLCGQRTVSTLDHHLPKTQYPCLVVSPVNLVPSCAECNKIKTDKIPLTGKQETLHPYFDDVESECWLKCDLIKKPLSMLFYVDPPKKWDDALSNRVKYHFESLELNELYISHASEEIINIYSSLNIVFDAGGEKEVCEFLNDAASSRKAVFKNSWQTALYTTLGNSDWFCNGGFKKI